MPVIVASTTTIVQYVKVFLTPMIPARAIMLGRDKAGPARRRASAGPCPMPDPMSPWRMGTSVRVAKYMKAPAIGGEEIGPERISAHEIVDIMLRDQGLIARAAQEEPGNQDTSGQQGDDLFHEQPGRLHPARELTPGEPELQLDSEDNQQDGRDVPLDAENEGPETGFTLGGPCKGRKDEDQDHGQQIEGFLCQGPLLARRPPEG